MTKYRVNWQEIVTFEHIVEADSPEDAWDQVCELSQEELLVIDSDLVEYSKEVSLDNE